MHMGCSNFERLIFLVGTTNGFYSTSRTELYENNSLVVCESDGELFLIELFTIGRPS